MEKELSKNIKLPVILKDKILMAPGTWNETVYTQEEVEKGYLNTDWKEKDNISLFLDHCDNPNEAAHNWIGFVRNPRISDGKVLV